MSLFKNLFHKNNLLIASFFLLLGVVSLAIIVHWGWKGENGDAWKSVISGDGKGYYSYIDQIFIHHNFGNAPIDHDIVHEVDGHSVIKFPCGTALLLLPFHKAIDLISPLVSKTYAAALHLEIISIASLLFFLLASIALMALFRRMGGKLSVSALMIAVFFFSSNLLLYVTLLPSMSHCYSYFAVSFFLYFAYCSIEKPCYPNLLGTGIFVGLVYLIRPFDLIILLFVPFFFASLKAFIHFIKTHIGKLLFVLCIALLIASIQHFLWYAQCGRFFIWSYQNEGFYFSRPEVLNFLFSFRKGLFIYTPLIIAPVLLSLYIFKKEKYKSIIFLIFFLLCIYLLSAWWCWTFSDGFGSRAMIVYYPVLMLVMVLAWKRLKRWMRIISLFFFLMCMLLNLTQSYQYILGILSPDNMNRASYKYIFLQTGKHYRNCIGGIHDLPLYNQYRKQLLAERSFPGVNNQSDPQQSNTDSVCLFNRNTEFCCTIELDSTNARIGLNRSWATIDFDLLDPAVNASSKALLVATIGVPGQNVRFYTSYKLNYLPDGNAQQWRHLSYSLILPAFNSTKDQLRIYIWNQGLESFSVKGFRVQVNGFEGD